MDARNFTARKSVPALVPLGILIAAVRLGDVVAYVAAGLASCWLVSALDYPAPFEPQILALMGAIAAASLCLAHLDGYAPGSVRKLWGRLLRRGLATLAGVAAASLCLSLVPEERALIPAWPLAWFMISMVLMALGHGLLSVAVRHWAATGRMSRRVAVVGVNEFSESFLTRAASHPDEGVEVVGVYRDQEDKPELSRHAGHRVRGTIEDVVLESRRDRIDAIVLAMPLTQPARIAHARRVLASVVGDVYVTTGLAGLKFQAGDLQAIAATPVVNVRRRPLTPWQVLQKNIFDRAAGALLLVALSAGLLAIAILIKLDSPGPVLFRQPRLGFNNRMFTVYKFRTMHHHAADLMADRQTTRDDPRITRVGRFLRKLSLDELPQLLNVLNGSMSLVGPRPHAPNTKAAGVLFQDGVAEYAVRHRVKPGITGWAQANGWRGETHTHEQIEQRVAHDLYYIDNWSLKLDIQILFLTVLREINSKTAF